VVASNGIEIEPGDSVRVVGNRALHPPGKRPAPHLGQAGVVVGPSGTKYPLQVEFPGGATANYLPGELEVVIIPHIPRKPR
jgi:hypothetical protein